MQTGTGAWRGMNTDVPGIQKPLSRVLRQSPSGAGATVIGAGGAARAAAFALLQMGMRVLILNRTARRAMHLAKDLADLLGLEREPPDGSPTGTDKPRVLAGELSPAADLYGHRDVIVQTTSVGMHGEGDPAPWLRFYGDELVFDIVYTPPETPFVMRSRAAGCRTITGDAMFEAQAEAQYEVFSRLAAS
jgi:3-dehydroquinate dehydratase/shikimate dehydrogenase